MNYQFLSRYQRHFYWLLVLSIVGFLFYFPALRAPFLMDDDHVIVHNIITKHLDLKALYFYDPFRFLTNVSFSLNFIFFGMSEIAYRLVNVSIHALNAFLIYLFARILMRFRSPNTCQEGYDGIPFAASFIFLIHPIQTQAVNYIVQRSTLLCTAFYLFALIFYIRFRLTSDIKAYLIFVISAVAAFYSKQTSITLLGSILLLELYFLRSGKQWFYVTAGALILFFAYQVQVNLHLLGELIYADRPTEYVEPLSYWMTQWGVLVWYLKLFLIPLHQNFDYDWNVLNRFTDPAVAGPLLVLLALLFAAWWWRKRRPLISFGVLFYFLILSPESSVVPMPDMIFEHRPYLAIFGIILSAILVLTEWIKREKARKIVFAATMIMWAVLVIQRNWVWGDAIRFMEDVAREAPEKARVRNNLGTFYLRSDHYAAAIQEFKHALTINPNYVESLQNLAETYWLMNDFANAREFSKRAARIAPKFANPYVTLGHLDFAEGDYEAAESDYREAIRRNANVSAAYNGLATIYHLKGDLQRAFEMAEQSVWVDSASAPANYILGNLYLQIADLYRAISCYERAIRINPKMVQAYNNLGNAYFRLGNYQRAKKYFKKIIELNPDFESAYFNLANAEYVLGGREAADAQLARAYETAKRNHNAALIQKIETFHQSQVNQPKE